MPLTRPATPPEVKRSPMASRDPTRAQDPARGRAREPSRVDRLHRLGHSRGHRHRLRAARLAWHEHPVPDALRDGGQPPGPPQLDGDADPRRARGSRSPDRLLPVAVRSGRVMSEEQWGYLVWGILAGIVAFPEVLARCRQGVRPVAGVRPDGGLPAGPKAAPDDGPARLLRRPDRPHHLVSPGRISRSRNGAIPSKGGGTLVHRPPIPGSWTLRRGNEILNRYMDHSRRFEAVAQRRTDERCGGGHSVHGSPQEARAGADRSGDSKSSS